MSQKRLYPKCADQMDDLVKHLSAKYEEEGFETQTLRVEKGDETGLVFQMRPKESAGAWFKKWTGLGKAATVNMKIVGDALEVEVGGGKWLDKAAAVLVSYFILWPLSVTATIGAFTQRSLLKDILAEIDAFFRGEAVCRKCAHCGADAADDAEFCSRCGKPLDAEAASK